jgi:hypothetical protein
MNRCLLACTILAGAMTLPPAVAAGHGEHRPVLDRADGVCYELHGVVQQYVAAITRQWLLTLPDTNPAILEMFAERDRQPPRNLLPWSGEFAGKYLTGAVLTLRLTRDPVLRQRIARFVGRLVALQADDGYLGPFARDNRLEGKQGAWDAWGHYHVMLGLLLWHEDTGDPQALRAAIRIGDLLCRKFLGTGRRVVDTGSEEMNHAVLHSLGLLYEITHTPAYLDLARQIVDEFQDRRAGNYVRAALAGREFYECRKPRWESLHALQGLAQLYWITGDPQARTAFERLWWSIVKLDRHNNGGFSSGEQAQGNPYHPGAIETCCTVAWIAMTVDMLRLTGNSVVADELELSTLNQVLGYQHPSGKWCTYNTPMDGARRKSTEEIGFQIRPGSEEINCCSANAPRGFGMIAQWALMGNGHGLVLNWYGPSTMTARLRGTEIVLTQRTGYPRDGRILLEVSPKEELRFPLKLRIPGWSAQSRVQVNGQPVAGVRPGSYLSVDRSWKPGDTVQIDLDLSLHYWVGQRQCAGKASIYRGPLLLVHQPGGTKRSDIRFSPGWRHFGEMSATSATGAFSEVAFEGPALVWKGQRFDDAGKARVTIDGRETAIVDQYAPGRNLPFSWECRNLPPGRHQARLTVLDQKNPASKGRWINLMELGAPPSPGPVFDAATIAGRLVAPPGLARPLVMMELTTVEGKKARLRDYGTAGEDGSPYASWLEVRNIAPSPFSQTNPLRCARVAEQNRGGSPPVH